MYVVTQTTNIYQLKTQSTDKSFSGQRTVTLDYYFINIVGQITFYGAVDRHRIKRLDRYITEPRHILSMHLNVSNNTQFGCFISDLGIPKIL